MNIVDVLIILWALAAIGRGLRIGFLRQSFSFGGFTGGLLLGSLYADSVGRLGTTTLGQALLTLLATLGTAIVVALLAEKVAAKIQSQLHFHVLHKANAFFGAVLSVAWVLIVSWLLGSIIMRLPSATIGLRIQESIVIQQVERVMPPAPTVLGQVGRLISPTGFPEVFVGEEPNTDLAGPPVEPQVAVATELAKASTVKIEGFGCGGVMSGSGFVANTNYVVTNAHVIAGVRQPVIIDSSGRRRAVPVWFDAKKDFAVLRTSNLAGPALLLADREVERGQTTAILGFPLGGDFKSTAGVVLNSHQAVGRDIYNRGLATRQVYEIQATIQQGNSGGPVVLPDGSIAGVVFGSSSRNESYAYALTADEIADDLKTAISRNSRVSTESCAPE